MTIYLPYRPSPTDELKFALRSIEKYFQHDVVLITDKPPEWYKGEVLLYPDCYPGVTGRRQFNIISKLYQVPDEQFIMFNDDHYLLQPLETIPHWYEGTLSQALKAAQGEYYNVINNTLKHFGDINYYDIHTPCVFTKEQIHRAFRLEWGDRDYLIKSAALNGCEGVEMKDLKIRRQITKEATEHLTKDRILFSTSPVGFKAGMVQFLSEIFPNKSRWEK